MLFFPNDIDFFESDMMIQFPNEDTVYALLSPHVTHIYMYICIWYGGRQKAVVQCSIKFSSIKSISFVDIFDDIFGDWVLTFDAILSCILLYFSDILICKDKKKECFTFLFNPGRRFYRTETCFYSQWNYQY